MTKTSPTLKVGSKVRLESLVGAYFTPDWSETGRIVRPRSNDIPQGYHAVRFDRDGARLLVHESRIRVAEAA